MKPKKAVRQDDVISGRGIFPLQWPPGRARTRPMDRKDARFRVSLADAWADLLYEIDRFDATNVAILSNAPVRPNGFPTASARVSDPGACATFTRGGRRVAIACDAYCELRANLRAISETLKAIRAVERHASTSIMEQAIAGFMLPARGADPDSGSGSGCGGDVGGGSRGGAVIDAEFVETADREVEAVAAQHRGAGGMRIGVDRIA